MERNQLYAAVSLLVNGWLHAQGDNKENLQIAIEELRQVANDWDETLATWDK